MIASQGSRSAQSVPLGRPSEDAAAIVIFRTVLAVALLVGISRTGADPDLWGHLRFGGDILARGISRVDPYSFTSDIPWVNHEWLAEVVMHLSWRLDGAAGLIALKLALASGALALIAIILTRDRLRGASRDFVLFAALVGMWQRISVVRPQIFSVALFAFLLWILRSSERGRPGRLWLLLPLFALWANLHGGWVVGLAALGIWTAIEASPLGRAGINWRLLIGLTIAATLATLINPYGLSLWRFLASTVRVDRPDIGDWRPLYRTQLSAVLPWLINAGLAAAAFARGRRSIPLSHVLVVVALGVGAVRVNRLDVFFSISVVMLLAGHMFQEHADRAQPLFWTRRVLVAAGIAVLVGAIAVWHVRPWFGCVALDGSWMPEREAGAFLVRNQFTGRMLTFFNWGEYVIWHLGPGVQVSFDGRRETVYSEAFITSHTRLYNDPASERAFLQHLAADYAWLPASLPLVHYLEHDGWSRLYSGPVSVILARHPVAAEAATPPTAPACFPGP